MSPAETTVSPPIQPVVDALPAAVGPVIQVEGRIASGDGFRPFALAGLTIVLVGLCVVLALPFLPALTWGVAFAIVAWPLHLVVKRRISRPNLAAGLTTLVVLALIVVPGLFVVYELASEAGSAADSVKEQSVETTLRNRIAEMPGLGKAARWMDRMNVDVVASLRKLVQSYTQDASSLLQGSLLGIIQFVAALFILFHFLKDGPLLRQRIRGLLPMTNAECDRVFAGAADSVHANVYATIVTSLIDAVAFGLLFWMLGLPYPILWGVVLFVLSVLPVLGTFVIWMPATAYLALSGRWPAALVVAGTGITTAIFIDTLLFVRLAGNRMRLHQVPALLAFLGGLAVFGASGMILGPAILAVTVAVLDVWHQRSEGAEVVSSNAEKTQAAAEVGLFTGEPSGVPLTSGGPSVPDEKRAPQAAEANGARGRKKARK